MTRTIPLTQGKVALVDDADYEELSKYSWFAVQDKGNLYAGRAHEGRRLGMHREIMNPPKRMIVDHVNGNGLDNRRENLRVCAYAGNAKNRRIGRNNTTGFKGVNWEESVGKFRARIMANYKSRNLGLFTDPIEAALAYDEAARELH